MGRYSPLPNKLREMLEQIEPSDADSDLPCYPCIVKLTDGRTIDRVYVEPEKPYLRYWGVYPEDDPGKRSISIDQVVRLESSPTRLPARFATEIYKLGEAGMGYTLFTLVFADGQRQAYGVSNAVDFLFYPVNKGPDDVVAIEAHDERNDPGRIDGTPEFYWCLYSQELS